MNIGIACISFLWTWAAAERLEASLQSFHHANHATKSESKQGCKDCKPGLIHIVLGRRSCSNGHCETLGPVLGQGNGKHNGIPFSWTQHQSDDGRHILQILGGHSIDDVLKPSILDATPEPLPLEESSVRSDLDDILSMSLGGQSTPYAGLSETKLQQMLMQELQAALITPSQYPNLDIDTLDPQDPLLAQLLSQYLQSSLSLPYSTSRSVSTPPLFPSVSTSSLSASDLLLLQQLLQLGMPQRTPALMNSTGLLSALGQQTTADTSSVDLLLQHFLHTSMNRSGVFAATSQQDSSAALYDLLIKQLLGQSLDGSSASPSGSDLSSVLSALRHHAEAERATPPPSPSVNIADLLAALGAQPKPPTTPKHVKVQIQTSVHAVPIKLHPTAESSAPSAPDQATSVSGLAD